MKEISESESRFFIEWINVHVGIEIKDRNLETFASKISQFADKNRLDSFDAIRKTLLDKSAITFHREFINTFTVNHTEFFREPSTLDYFEEEILKQYEGRELSLWSAACSSGQEPYSLSAIMQYKKNKIRDYKILCTDIDCHALKKAEQGVYKAHNFSKVKEQYMPHLVDSDFKIIKDNHKHCMFRKLNLLHSPWPMKNKLDVIFCRNVLYYFDEQTQKKLLSRFYNQTNPGGWLVTSVTETIKELASDWKFLQPGIYRKRD